MPITKNKSGNRLSSMFSTSSSDLTALTSLASKESRRASTHNLSIPDRTIPPPTAAHTASNGSSGNAPWMPPQHQRADSGHVRRPYNQHLAPLAPPAEVHRKPVGDFARDGSSQMSLHPSSATSSPIHTPRSASAFSSQPSSPYQTTPSPHTAVDHPSALPVLGHSGSGSPTTGKIKRKSWFAGSGKHSKKEEEEEQKRSSAWILGHDNQHPPYDLGPLINAQRVSQTSATCSVFEVTNVTRCRSFGTLKATPSFISFRERPGKARRSALTQACTPLVQC
jgi:hypothetical protein